MFNRIIFTFGALLFLTVQTRAELHIDGFLQTLHGGGLDHTNPTATEMTASETRLQLRAEHYGDGAEFFGRLDFFYDGADIGEYDWELREGYLKFRLGQHLDFKFGRQVLTWGTGDLIFINDLFAKDYRSFFTGRDDQYLKAPQNALRTELYTGLGSLTFVWTPRFEPNRLPTGRKLSYFNGRQIVGEGYYFDPSTPDRSFKNSELAVRFNRMLGSYSTSLYFYKGFYKNPLGAVMVNIDNVLTPFPVYPRLYAYGASIRGPLAGGIVWLEGGYFDSRDDIDGDNPLMPNSQIVGMIGFERQVANNLTMNLQWKAESMLDYQLYRSQNESSGMYVRDELYHLITSRITKLMFDELLTLSTFVFYSPSDDDVYLRFSANYKYSDELALVVGGNIFDGKYDATEFGQFRKNDNIYIKATYGF